MADEIIISLPISPAVADVAGAPAAQIEHYVRMVGRPAGTGPYQAFVPSSPSSPVSSEHSLRSQAAINMRRSLETIRDLVGADVEQGPEIAETSLEAIDAFAELAPVPSEELDALMERLREWTDKDMLGSSLTEEALSALQSLPAEVERLREAAQAAVKAHRDNSGAEPSVSVFERAMDRLAALSLTQKEAGEVKLTKAQRRVLTSVQGGAVLLHFDVWAGYWWTENGKRLSAYGKSETFPPLPLRRLLDGGLARTGTPIRLASGSQISAYCITPAGRLALTQDTGADHDH